MGYKANPIQFNLEMPYSDLFNKEAWNGYKPTQSNYGSQSQLQVQVLLTVPKVNKPSTRPYCTRFFPTGTPIPALPLSKSLVAYLHSMEAMQMPSTTNR